MTTLIDRAKEVRDAIRHCANSEGVSDCRQCYYYTNGCRYSLMLISARIIDRLIQELKNVEPVRHGRWKCNKPCPVCGEDRFKGLDADIWADWEPPYCPNCGARMDGE